MIPSAKTVALLRHLASRPGRDEVKAGFRDLLHEEFGADLGDLRFEQRVEVKSRIDALTGRTVFDAIRNLDLERADVLRKMPEYLAAREADTGEKFIGVAADGLLWCVSALADGALLELKSFRLDPEQPGGFLAFLDGALALKSSLPPDPLTIRNELGRQSVAFRTTDQSLRALWRKLECDPAVALKRQLWAELLKLVHGREVESEALWFQHTFLVIVAKCIALALVRLPEDDPRRLLSGEAFVAAGIKGAVESDFFDWIVADAEGVALVRRIMSHVRRFRLAEVESDVLKILYESLIDRDERHGLGEYYTPDWLAAKIVRNAVDRPLEQRVLDPGCGSGTFLFHAVRNFLKEAEDAGVEPARRAFEASQLVKGFDIHPVAVIIARVTYLLALAPALPQRKGGLAVPVYLGDAMQLAVSQVMTEQKITVVAPAEQEGLPKIAMDFPEVFCRNADLFDKMIDIIRVGSEQSRSRAFVETQMTQSAKAHFQTARHPLDPPRELGEQEAHGVRDLGATYEIYDRLRHEGRDSVWAYVARNLSRPLSLSASGGWAHVLVGNPPWVAYRHMSADLQKRFKELAKGERVYVGGKFATQNDLCALFVVRTVTLYLRSSGRLGFVMPLATLTRGQYERFQSGSFETARIAWDEVWTMDDRVQPLFPAPACAVFGRRRAASKPLPGKVRAYCGDLPMRDAPEAIADARLEVRDGAPALEVGQFEGGSPYRKAFRQGATLVPRMLCLVERKSLGRLGMDLSAPYVVSRRSTQEKRPWKDLPSIDNRVEAEFLHPVLLGESILPYRLFQSFEGVVAVTEKGEVLDAEAAASRGISGLSDWMRKAEGIWSQFSETTENITLAQQLDYYGKLSSQFPLARLRIAYSTSGTLPAAAIVRESRFIIDTSLYWFAPASLAEAQFLAAILNSEAARRSSEKWQSRGQFGARHFHKVMFNLPIPLFDSNNPLHAALVKAAAKAEVIAAAQPLPESAKFQRARKRVRDALKDAGVADEIDALVAELLVGGAKRARAPSPR